LGFVDDAQIACLKPSDSGTFKVENLGKSESLKISHTLMIGMYGANQVNTGYDDCLQIHEDRD
jgi:hypothetical protein